MMEALPILYENNDLIAVFKPHGLLVHRSKIAEDVQEFALQILRNQLGHHVYPVHRLDRKTSGVLLFAKHEQANKDLQAMFMEGHVHKTYQALVRGYTENEGCIDSPLQNGAKTQDAVTHYITLERFEIPLAFGKHHTSRYSFIELHPMTGRFHQLRKHLAHIRHPIIGDRPHGCNKQNKLWKERFGMTTMLLHASQIEFTYKGQQHHIIADKGDVFEKAIVQLKEFAI